MQQLQTQIKHKSSYSLTAEYEPIFKSVITSCLMKVKG